MKKVILLSLTVCVLITTILFASIYIPNKASEYKTKNQDNIVKAYTVEYGKELEFESNLTTNFKDGFKVYALDNISKNGGTTNTSKDETQIKIVETDTDKIEDIMQQFPSEIEYEEEGYSGTLVLDTSSIITTKISDGSFYKSYNVNETVEYRNYSKNDMDKIPKTKIKNGVNMHLISVDWKVQNTEMIGNSQVPVSYIAIAYYKGTGSRLISGESKYTSSATYFGVVEKEEVNPMEYVVTYTKVADYTPIIIATSIMGGLGVILIISGFVQYAMNKKKNK